MEFSARALAAATTTGLAISAAVLTPGAGATTPTTTDPSTSPAAVARIYVSLPRQGKAAPSAALIARGLRTAAKARGDEAGGRRIKLVWLDDATGDRWDAAKVTANAERAAADPTAIAYVGEGNSEATALAMPIVNRAGLAHLSPVSTATSLTSADRASELQPTGARTFFRPLPDDARQGTALVAYARASGVTSDVLLVDDGGLYGRGLTTAFADEGARTGVRTAGRRVVAPDGAGLGDLVREVRSRKPRAIVYGGAPSSGAAAVIRALHDASPTTLIFGGEALANDAFAKDAGAAQSVLRLTAPAAHADPRRTRTHGLRRRPAAFTVFAHNGMTALLRAVDRSARSGAMTRESVRTAVFDGTVQTGLSGAWTITATGDSTYGVFDELRLARGRVLTPGETAVGSLVRKQRAALKARLRNERRLGRAAVVPSKAQAPRSVSLSTMNIASMDIETALLMVQSERTKLLDEQLRSQINEVQARNEQLARLTTVLGHLNTIRGKFPSGSNAGTPTTRITDPGTVLADLEKALVAANVTGLGTWTLGEVDTAIVRLKGMVDAASNSQQMDMLRLQSMSNKRNEAFDVMANFLKKMQESRSSIIGNLR